MINVFNFKYLLSISKRVHKLKFYISIYGLISITLFLIGSYINFIAYNSIEPIIISCIFFVFFYFLLTLLKVKGKYELQSYIITYCISWFWAGVSAIYANFFNDPGQLKLDAAQFYEMVSGNFISGLNLIEISSTLENAAAIIIWKFFYNVFSFFGFSNGRFIGISVNTIFIAYTSVIAIKIAGVVFDNDVIKLKRLINLLWLCPIFWYFASVHIRDAAVLFSVSFLSLFWVIYLKFFTFVNLLKLIIATIISFFVFGLLRTEFLFVPFAMIATGIFVLIFNRQNKILIYLFIFIAIFLVILMPNFSFEESKFFNDISNGNESYNSLSSEESGSSSLGNALIVSSPTPIRLFLGSVYLFVFPVPVWSGFQITSIGHLFKSLNAIYMYSLTPLFLFAIWEIIKNKEKRTLPIMFLFLLSSGFTIAVAYTSLETRHFAAFLLPVMILSLVPNFAIDKIKVSINNLRIRFVLVMVAIHFLWIILKFLI